MESNRFTLSKHVGRQVRINRPGDHRDGQVGKLIGFTEKGICRVDLGTDKLFQIHADYLKPTRKPVTANELGI